MKTYAIGFPAHVERSPLEFLERFKEDGHERLDIFCGVLGCPDRFTKICVRETHADGLIQEE